jgi:hypothetical protein
VIYVCREVKVLICATIAVIVEEVTELSSTVRLRTAIFTAIAWVLIEVIKMLKTAHERTLPLYT